MRAPRGDRAVGVRMFLGLCFLAATGTALLVLPIPQIFAHAAPALAHVFSSHPVHH